MREISIPENILASVDRPTRYIGGEINSIMKDPDNVSVNFVMCFPDVYEIGMSYLGAQIIYSMLNSIEWVWCQRVYSPWPDMDAAMRKNNIPLFALESQTPVREADFLGITLQYEMCYTNVLQILDLSQIPLSSRERTWDDPIVMGGGPCAINPEPVAEFFDLFYIGEAETMLAHLMETYRDCRTNGLSRVRFLEEAAHIPGIYVPLLYEPSYNEDGTIKSFMPLADGIPKRIKRQVCADMESAPYPERPVVPFLQATQDRAVLEVMRGCIRGCRFCQAGMIYRPLRQKTPERLLLLAQKILESTGHEEISLSSLSSSDYYGLRTLIEGLLDYCTQRKINIALPSLRIDEFSLDVMSRVQDVKKSSLTFAPEGGTQRIRDVINKGISEDDIMSGAAAAFVGGWNKVKLYFMLGLPTETEDDIRGIARLCERVSEKYYATVPKEGRNGRVQINASASFFVPKPFTPFQWASMEDEVEYLRRAYIVKDEFKRQLNKKSMRFSYHDADVTILEGVLARGDRRLSAAIAMAYGNGCMFDAWSDFFDIGKWKAAFDATGTDIEFYTKRKREKDEIFPWDFIDIGIDRNFLLREWERAMEGKVTPNCRQACSGCGAAGLGGDCCPEEKKT